MFKPTKPLHSTLEICSADSSTYPHQQDPPSAASGLTEDVPADGQHHSDPPSAVTTFAEDDSTVLKAVPEGNGSPGVAREPKLGSIDPTLAGSDDSQLDSDGTTNRYLLSRKAGRAAW